MEATHLWQRCFKGGVSFIWCHTGVRANLPLHQGCGLWALLTVIPGSLPYRGALGSNPLGGPLAQGATLSPSAFHLMVLVSTEDPCLIL